MTQLDDVRALFDGPNIAHNKYIGRPYPLRSDRVVYLLASAQRFG